ncbi:ribulose-phosphate 3-epimerase [Candidatus Peregrinibacteria bacterium]|nr:ribulose-phosphate 3-epimerase [Candidatus Peregrinibacteria bacterium]
MAKKVQIAPSILSADFGKLSAEIAEVQPFSDRIHFDVMDGHFVPNISFGAPILKWVKTKLPIDVHLMIERPWLYLGDFVKAGGDLIIVHSEVCAKTGKNSLVNVLKIVKRLGAKTGVSIKPKTSVETLVKQLGKKWLSHLDQILIMTVEPGFGGQSFMPKMVGKIGQLRKMGFKGDIAIDGGINAKTGKVCVEAGADILIAGNYIFGAKDRVKAVKSLR